MKLFSTETYINRRNALKNALGSGQILILGNNESPMNYADNTYRFRQDSNFLYFFGISLPGLAAWIDIDKNEEIIYGHEYTIDDIIWIGRQEPLHVLANKVGVNTVLEPEKLATKISPAVMYLPPYRHDNKILLSNLLHISLDQLAPSESLTKAVINLRMHKAPEEIAEMEKAVNITREMHLAAMRATKGGKYEYEAVAKIMETMHRHNAELSYPVIFSVNGQTLHNHYHGNRMEAGQLALNDSGCETEMCYAGDITRTFPVSGKFSETQKEIYTAVLDMLESSTALLKPGIMYRDVHINANRILLGHLKNIGLVQGDTEEMLAAGVGGLFMPHGLGHNIGLDVHDMEDLGENLVGYREGLARSTQLGLRSLRMARELETGNVITVEPGCYFIPELIEKYKAEGIFKEYVNYAQLEAYYDFGGVRIEDNVLITDTGHRVLGERIAKTVAEVEAVMAGGF
ncbi:MAG: aminopeptidase P family protein [Spirosomataceae bacterium]